MMDDLIARLEAASEGSRELDDAIAKSIGSRIIPLDVAFGRNDGCWVRRVGDQLIGIGSHNDHGTSSTDFYLPRYTTSIDAALPLVPAGYGYVGLQRFSDGWYAQVAQSSTSFRHEGTQKPAALALCIAALKARSVTIPVTKS